MSTAKLHPPESLQILGRERLIARLQSFEDRKLLLIHAQAGQGKSTLAADYVRSLPGPSVWYTLDRQDDDPGRFLSGLGTALQAAFPAIRPVLPPAARDMFSRSYDAPVVRWVRQAFGEITTPCLIVLDDFSSTSSPPPLLHVLNMLLEHTPSSVRIMIISRTKPDLPLAGLRVRRQVAEISGADLRFTDREVEDLFNVVFGMRLDRTEAVFINRKAEGWPAGLVLMHEYLSSAAPRVRVTGIRDGEREYQEQIFDYLAQEVFSSLPEELRVFLLRTAVPDYLPSGLTEALAGIERTRATALVDELLRRNLFVTPLDTGRTSIRYHSLFRGFLLRNLKATAKPAEIRKLHSLASAHFRKTRDFVRAIDLLFADGQSGKAVQAIDSCAPDLIARGQVLSVLRWREQVPGEDRDLPWFLFAKALFCRFSDPGAALSLYEHARKRFKTRASGANRNSGQMLCLCGIIESAFHAGGRYCMMARAASEAQRLLASSKGDSRTTARLLLAMGTAWFFLGSLDRSRSALLQAGNLFQKLGDVYYQIMCSIYLVPCALYQGDFRLAREAVLNGLEAQAAIPGETGSRAGLLATRAMAALFEGNFSEAQECLDECTSLTENHSLESIALLALLIGGWVRIAQGDFPAAVGLLADCRRGAEQAGNDFYAASASHLLAIAWLFESKLKKAKAESDRALALAHRSGSGLFTAIYRIASGAINLKLGKLPLAEQELLRAVNTLRQLGAAQQEANAHLVLAMLYDRKNRPDRSRKHRKSGFSIGQERGFRYYAVLTRSELVKLAAEAVSEGTCEEYCASLGAGRLLREPVLSLQCLGGFKAFRGKREVKDTQWKSRRAKMLVKLLAAQEGHRLPREQAMELLWPDAGGKDLRPLFNSLLHRARKVLDPEVPGRDIFCIQHEGDLISLNTDLVSTDVGRFLEHTDRLFRSRSGTDPKGLLSGYEQAVELYRGDFLPEDVYADWSTRTRDSLRERYLRVLDEAGDLADALGDADRSQKFYEAMFHADPCSEKACQRLMKRYLAVGERNEAVRTYERCERALAKDMDMEPDEKTKKLYRSIIGG